MQHSSVCAQVYLIAILIINLNSAKRVNYISTERPAISYLNPKYVSYATFKSRRYSRQDPIYYVGAHFILNTSINYNVSLDIYFYEWLTNQYKRGFVEMHFEFCHFIHNDPFFGAALRQGKLDKPCPYPAGEYFLYNMSIPLKQVPHNFPFRKGRIYLNVSSLDTKELMGTGHIDMEIKQLTIKDKIN